MPTVSRSTARAQRRDLARAAGRSAVLTVALPSAASLVVFAAAAATAQLPAQRQATAASARERVRAADRQALAVAAEREAWAEQAAREQARLALAERRQAERLRAEAERPKFVLPVTEHGLSALFGEAGTHWSARHTGIDFPVAARTPVHAATDGTVATHWHPAYGRMATVTAPDGTETWYCHLGGYRLTEGAVQAGDVIAYSGSTGNSTGPHLHFEVRPSGGAPIDPLPWLLDHGLDPR